MAGRVPVVLAGALSDRAAEVVREMACPEAADF